MDVALALAAGQATHGAALVRPPGHHFATGQVSQSSWLRKATPDRRNVPSSQDAGMRALEPGGHMKPSPHVTHSVAPSLPWYLPSTHIGHCWLVGSAVAVPFPHGVGTVEPAKQKLPAPHAPQLAALPCPASLLYRPASHGADLALMLPASQ